MRILWIAQKDFQRDLDISTWVEMAQQFGEQGHQVILVGLRAHRKRHLTEPSRFRLRQLPVLNCFPFVAITFHLQILWRSCIWLATEQPDIVLTHPFTAIFLLPARMLARIGRMKTKFVLDIRTLPVRQKNFNDKIKSWLITQTIKLAKKYFDGITVITPELRKFIAERYQISPETMGIWMSGVNSDFFCPRTQPPPSAPFTVMYHGALAEQRGLAETIQAMASVAQRNLPITLRLLGQGPAAGQLEQLIQQLGLAQVVQLNRSVPYQQMPEQIARADVGIIPLPDEPCWRVGSPLKLFEYLAMAKPVILSPIAAHRHAVGNCPAAIFLKSTAAADIAAGIITAYSLRDQFAWRGQQGRELILTQFTWKRQAEQLARYLNQQLNSNHHSN